MSYEIVRSLSFNKEGAKVSLACSNVFPKHFESITIEPEEGETVEDVKSSVFNLLKGGSFQIQPSVRTNAHLAFIISDLAKAYILKDYFKIDSASIFRNFLLEDIVYDQKPGLELDELEIPSLFDIFQGVFDRGDLVDEDGNVRAISFDFLYPMNLLRSTMGSQNLLRQIFVANYIQREVFIHYSSNNRFNSEIQDHSFMRFDGRLADITFSNRFRYGAFPRSLKENLFTWNKHGFDSRMSFSDLDLNDLSLKDVLDKCINIDGLLDKYAKPIKENTVEDIKLSTEDIDNIEYLINIKDLDKLYEELSSLLKN